MGISRNIFSKGGNGVPNLGQNDLFLLLFLRRGAMADGSSRGDIACQDIVVLVNLKTRQTNNQ